MGPKAWLKWVLGAVVLVAIAILLYDPFDPGPPAVAAEWEVDPEADLNPASTSVAIIVNEIECASGRSAEGRIEVEVVYQADEVKIEVGVRPRTGEGVTCRNCSGP